jgi:hypothetical protein
MTKDEQSYLTALKQTALAGAVEAMKMDRGVTQMDVGTVNNALKPRVTIALGGNRVMFDVTLDIVPVPEG